MKNFLRKVKENKESFLNEQFFRPGWYSVFLNPYFINRRSLYIAMKSFAGRINTGQAGNIKHGSDPAKILDVGCGIKPYRNLFKTGSYTGIDIQGGGHVDANKLVDAFYDGLHIPFPNSSFDVVICTQVMEHATDAKVLEAECSRVLTPGGSIFISMPFIYPEHEQPYDFRRYTSFQHIRMLKENGFNSIEVKKTTGFFGTFAQLFCVFIFEGMIFRSTLIKGLLSLIFFGPIQVIGIALDTLTGKAGPTMDYVVEAKKK